MSLTCRFYKNRLPDIDEHVMLLVTNVAEVGVDVNLLEYDGRQGMIPLKELSRVRIRSIRRLVRRNQKEVGVVIRIDREKGYIDLSKREVSEEERTRCEEKYNRGRTVNSILRHTAELAGVETNEGFEELYENVAWFYDEKHHSPGAAYDVFVRAVSDEHELDDCPIDERTRAVLLEDIRRRLTVPPVRCQANFQLAYFGYEGIDVIKAALRTGLTLSTEEIPVKINLVAAPLYMISTVTTDKTQGFTLVKRALTLIKTAIEKAGGTFRIKTEAFVANEETTTADQESTSESDSDESDQALPEQSDSEDDDGTIAFELSEEQ